MHAGTVEDHKLLATTAAKAIAEGEASVAKVESSARAAQDRVERIERGEDVAGFGKRMTPEDLEAILKAAGFTNRDFRQMRRLAEIPEEIFSTLLRDEVMKRYDVANNASINAIWRKYGRKQH
jgi:hypothetical protein